MARRPDIDRSMIGVFGCASGPEEIAEVAPSILEGWMGMGSRVREFEKEFSNRLGQGFVMTNSGSSALHLAVAALDLPDGSEVIVPSLTWVACAHAALMSGHRPVFADVDLDTLSMRSEDAQRVLTDRTAALMIVHYAGKPAPLEGLVSLGVPIIEDAAHAVDSKLGDRRCGTLGDVGIFSFDSVKNLATPDAGGLTSPREDILDRARSLRYCGMGPPGFARAEQRDRWWQDDIVAIFPRVIPNDVSAGIGLAQLRRLEENQRRRREVWDAYQKELASLPWLSLPPEPAADERHSWFTYLVRVLDGRRDSLAAYLYEHSIYTTLRYHPLHLSPIFGPQPSLPNSERLAEEGLNLPLHPRLSQEDVDRIIDAIRRF